MFRRRSWRFPGSLGDIGNRIKAAGVSSQDAGDAPALVFASRRSYGVCPAKAPVWPVVIVLVLPLFQFLVKQMNVVRDPVTVEELVELLVVDAMGSLQDPQNGWRPVRSRQSSRVIWLAHCLMPSHGTTKSAYRRGCVL
jgi:hypothetical protein